MTILQEIVPTQEKKRPRTITMNAENESQGSNSFVG